MKHLNNPKYLIWILFFFINSCDCGYNYIFEINNGLSTNIRITYIDNHDKVQSVSVAPTKTFKIEGFGGWCTCSTKCYAEPIQDSIIDEYEIKNIIVYHNSIVSKTNFNDINLWTFKSMSGLGTYTVKVDTTDF